MRNYSTIYALNEQQPIRSETQDLHFLIQPGSIRRNLFLTRTHIKQLIVRVRFILLVSLHVF
jgi:hypothetical protein